MTPEASRVLAEAERLLKAVTKADEWQCLRRDRDQGDIEYQIFADCDPEGEQIAWVQSTRGDAEFIAAAPQLVRDLVALLAVQQEKDNHHSALLCPYCNPKGLKKLVDPGPSVPLAEIVQEMREAVLNADRPYPIAIFHESITSWADRLAALTGQKEPNK